MCTSNACLCSRPIRAGRLQKLFAWVQSKGNAGYERMMESRKRTLFEDVSGTVLEIGPGLGFLTERLVASGASVTADTTRRMGLFVVSRLAERHGISIEQAEQLIDQHGNSREKLDEAARQMKG